MSDPNDRRDEGLRPGAALALTGIVLLAFWVRAAGFEWIFVGDDEVVLRLGDGHYHARRALVSFLRFPSFLVWDPYINYPRGAPVQLPPLYDMLTAGFARLLGGDVNTLERVLAWWAPVSGALTVIPVYAAARRVADRGAALLAGGIFALLPIVVTSSRVGDADKTAFIGLLGACLLVLVLELVSPRSRGPRAIAAGAGLAAVAFVLPLCWSGSLLYTGIGFSLVIAVAALEARRDVLEVTAAALAAAGLALLPVVSSLPEPLGGPFSAIALSYLHVHFTLAAALVALCAALLERFRPDRRAAGRVLGLLAIGAGIAALELLGSGARGALVQVLDFAGGATVPGVATQEMLPLFSLPGRPAAQPATLYFGWFAYLVPLAPLGAWLATRTPGRRTPAWLLVVWTSSLALLTLWQARHGADFAASAAVAFSLLLVAPIAALQRRWPLPSPVRVGAVAVVVVAMLWVPIQTAYLPWSRGSIAALVSGPPAGDRALATPEGTLTRFLQDVRRLTPETAGYIDADATPEYGILVSPNLGHALQHVARRASPANGFQHLLDPDVYAASRQFFDSRLEIEGVAVAADLRARYAITLHFPGAQPGSLAQRLHEFDGAATRRAPRIRSLRLVTDAPAGGRPMTDLLGIVSPPGVVAYKLFEFVPGAVLEVVGAPGEAIRVEVDLRTNTGRRFTHSAAARVGPTGRAPVRVPYSTDGDLPVRAVGPYRVEVGTGSVRVVVPEEAVRQGSVILVERGTE